MRSLSPISWCCYLEPYPSSIWWGVQLISDIYATLKRLLSKMLTKLIKLTKYLMIQELILGQFHRQGPISVWRISPIFKGSWFSKTYQINIYQPVRSQNWIKIELTPRSRILCSVHRLLRLVLLQRDHRLGFPLPLLIIIIAPALEGRLNMTLSFFSTFFSLFPWKVV